MNTYSPVWFTLFMRSIDPARTEHECAWLVRHLPLPDCRRVLDLPCGEGRHAHALAQRGYDVLGIDRDPQAVARAEDGAPAGCRFRIDDMQRAAAWDETHDAVICLWQSFGHYDDRTNRDVLAGMVSRLRPGGRFILDVYHRGYFETEREPRRWERDEIAIVESAALHESRLTVRLDYSTGGHDEFSWHLYSVEELNRLGEEVGLARVTACRNFDRDQLPSNEEARVQLVFEKK
ncbi:MAG: class I SAM-dependent methyltransferase [Planctomycetota bacterium]|nr:class I SAM-dependent methyltransferase [Planctomycetota bacterium]